MDLLYTINSFMPSIGGTQYLLHTKVKGLMEKHNVQVVTSWDNNRTDWLVGSTLRAPEEPKDYIFEDVKVHRIGLSKKEKISIAPAVFYYYPAMDRAIPKISVVFEKHLEPFAEKCDLIHNIRQGRENISYASLNLAKKKDVPFVFTPVHHPRWTGWRYKAFIDLYKMSDMIFTLTEAEKKIMMNFGVKEENIVVTGMGPDLAPSANPEIFLKNHNIDGPMILFLGRHDLYKGFSYLLEATKKVWEKHPEAHFVFVGPPVKKSEKYFKGLHDKRIIRLGSVDLQTKSDVLAASTLLCVPSSQESFGAIYTEAWNYSKPVIGCNIPAVADVISDGADGYLVEQNSDDIAEKINMLLSDSKKLEEFGAAGKRKYEKKYTWNTITGIVEDAYKSLIK